MKKLVSYCGPRVPVLEEMDDGEGNAVLVQIGETMPDGSPIVEGIVDMTPEEIAELEAMAGG